MGIEKKIQETNNCSSIYRSLTWDDWIPVYGFIKDEYNALHDKPIVDDRKWVVVPWVFYQAATIGFLVISPVLLK